MALPDPLLRLGFMYLTSPFTIIYDCSLEITGHRSLDMGQLSMNSEKTQLTRKAVSAPMRWVKDNLEYSFDDWNVLHFGEGKAFPDSAEMVRMGFAVTPYDPNSKDFYTRNPDNIDPSLHIYDIGFSFYVFNTLNQYWREQAFNEMMRCCKRLIIAVRTDRVPGEKCQDGVITKRLTFQTQLNKDQWLEYFTLISPVRSSVSLLHNGGHFAIIEVVGKR